MCGFVAVYEYGRREGGVSPALIGHMRETLRHRGPDGEGLFVSPDRRVGLGHRRLAIVDPAGGQQPMFGPNGECLVFNGEIYNYPALRRDLERDGVEFATDCDTEVILHLYARHGRDCVEHLTGMFSFALWDPASENLLFARDPIGEKPLYWAIGDGRLVLASEIKAILEHPAIHAEVNEAALAPYLANLVSVTPATLFRGIRKLPPGTRGVCRASGVRFERFFELFAPRSWEETSLSESAATVRSMLTASVKARLMSDVPIGVLLSGGLDSTTLVALLHERARGMASFSVGFPGSPELDERQEARRVAERFGTEHHEVEVSEEDALRFLPGLVHHQDEPLADPVCVPLHFVCGLARRNGVKVVLAGEGADELFWGYPRYRRTMARWGLIRTALRLPSPLRRALSHSVSARRHPSIRDQADGLAAGRLLPMHLPLGLPRAERERILGEPGEVGWTSSVDGQADQETPLQSLAFDTQEYEFGLRLPELLLMRIDRFSMANGIEARVPFLDPALVDYVYRLPVTHKLSDGVTKLVLREAVADLVPEWVLRRGKQGFGAPIATWLELRFGQLLRELLRDRQMSRYFDVAEVEGIASQRGAWASWPILNFALWHRYWVQGEALDGLVERTLSSEVVG